MASDRQNHLILVRHGQSKTNAGAEVTDNEMNILTRKGIKQAFRAGELLDKYKFAAVYSSPIARAIQTTTTLLSAADHEPITIRKVDSLVERKYGFDRFLKWEELEQLFGKDNVRRSDEDIDYSLDKVEKQRSVYERVSRAFIDHIVPALGCGNVLVVSHFYVMRALQSLIEYGGPEGMPHFYPDNAAPVKYSRSRVIDAVGKRVTGEDRMGQIGNGSYIFLTPGAP